MLICSVCLSSQPSDQLQSSYPSHMCAYSLTFQTLPQRCSLHECVCAHEYVVYLQYAVTLTRFGGETSNSYVHTHTLAQTPLLTHTRHYSP